MMDWWEYETAATQEGWRILCGVDEAGRGCLAGPVYAAAVILPAGLLVDGLNDSKKLTPEKRERVYDIITEKSISFGIGTASEREIDEVNILNATFLAMNRAIGQLDPLPEMALIDGNRNKGIQYLNRCIIGGDGKSASIAAASILAKVSRDRYMCELSEQYPEYFFHIHKGYGTQTHYDMLKKHGPSAAHRKTFLKKMH